MTPWLIGDVIGFVMAIRVFRAWIRDQGWRVWEWHGVLTHLLKCSFCSGFWAAFIMLLISDQNPLHAFSCAAAVYAYTRLFNDDQIPATIQQQPVFQNLRIPVNPPSAAPGERPIMLNMAPPPNPGPPPTRWPWMEQDENHG